MSLTEEWRVRRGLARTRRLVMKSLFSFLLLGVLLHPYPTQAQDATKLIGGDIATFAGSLDPNAPSRYDSIAADGSLIAQPGSIFVDKAGNIYFASPSQAAGVWVIYGGQTVPPILALRVPHPTKGFQYKLAGSLDPANSTPCTPPDTCGDGGPALAPAQLPNGEIPPSTLGTPTGIAVDAAGNLYIADATLQSIRMVSASTGNISTIAGDPMHSQSGYSGDGGPATAAILFSPSAVAVDNAGNIYIADANYVIHRIDGPQGANPDQINAVGGNVAAATAANGSGNPPLDCSSSTDSCGEGGAPLSATLGYVAGMSFDTQGNLFLAEADIYVIREIDFSSKSPTIHTVAGTLRTACSDTNCGDGHAATSGMLNSPYDVIADANGNLVISDQADNAIRLVTKSDGNIQTIAGQISQTGGYGGDNGPATSAMLNLPYGIGLDSNGNLYIADQYNNLIREVTPPSNRTPQTISYKAPPPQTYGNGPLDLNNYFTNTSASGFNFTYQLISGPATLNGFILTITGAGAVKVTASLPGDSTWAPASQTESISVAPATLTVTGLVNFNLQEGQPVPSTIAYTISGFASGDSQSSVLTGAPTIVVVDAKGVPIPAGTVLPVGTYTVKVTQGSLALTKNYAQDYVFNLVNSSLLVTLGRSQKVAFSNITPPATYGDPRSSFSFSVTATSGLPVDVAFTGPVNTQQTTTGWNVTIAGAGKVTITATQGGNTTYAPATATQSFIVNPALLIITPANVTRPYNTPNPAFTDVATGFVGSDTAAVLTGAPVYSTTATQTSVAGTYSITATQGTLFAQNYSFVFKPGTLTITPATQTIMFGDVKDTPYNATETVAASATSGLPVTYTASGPVTLTPAPDGSNVLVNPTDIGAVTITAAQAGNQDYSPAPPATVSLNVVRAEADILVLSASRPVGAPNPTFQFQISPAQGVNIDPIAPPYFTGTPNITTTADQSSPPGQYFITPTQGSLTAEHYYFVFDQGTLTVTSASSYILTTNPTSVTVPRGQSRQISVIVTQVNNYAGNVTLGCSGLPAGVTCGFSPGALTIPMGSNGQAATPVQGTLTITTNGGTAAAGPLEIWRKDPPFTAGLFLLPGVAGGIVLLLGRRRFLKNARSQYGLVFLVLLCVQGALTACGGGGSSGAAQAQPGTTTIQITGSGSGAAGASDLTQTVSLSLTVQ